MAEIDKLVQDLANVEDQIIKETTDQLDDTEKLLILFLFQEAKDSNFLLNYQTVVQRGLDFYNPVKNEFLQMLPRMFPEVDKIREWSGVGPMDFERLRLLREQKANEIDTLINQSVSLIAAQIGFMLAMNMKRTRKNIQNIVKRSHVVRYGSEFAEPGRLSAGLIHEDLRYGYYASRSGPLVIPTSRAFCVHNAGRIRLMRTWRSMLPFFPLTGGKQIANCRHVLIPMSKKKKGEVENELKK